MTKLDMEKIMQQVGCTESEFSEEMGISLADLRDYCEGSKQLTGELLSKMCQYTGLMPSEGGIFKCDNPTLFIAHSIKPSDTYEPSQQAKTNLISYIQQGFTEFHEDTVLTEIKKVQRCISALRKPRISFAGQSDTGKSTLINALLGADKMPAKWTPTTSIVVHIKHIDDRPSFMSEEVWIFGKKSNELWDDARLNDEVYCNDFLIAKGDFSLLQDFGTHQNETESRPVASSAVAFIDSPLLKDCDILDLPGFAATSEDDALHRFNTQTHVTDILLYLSRANGFLQDRDLDYLHECLKSLRPIEKAGRNGIDKLENLFIIASQAGSVSNGNNSELTEIMDRRCKALCDSYALAAKETNSDSLLPFRSIHTGYNYSEADFRKRFFTYEKDMSRLCKNFDAAFTKLAENLPKALHQEFISSLKAIANGSNAIIRKRIEEWLDLFTNKAKYADLVREIKQKEPVRLIERKEKNTEMISLIAACCTSAKQKTQTAYDTTINTDHLVSLMETLGVKNKKSSKEDFSTSVNEVLSRKIQDTMHTQTEYYAKHLDEYLSDYAKSLNQYSSKNGVNVDFDTTNSFALGLTSLGALGASAAWLASSVTAFSVSIFGAYAGWEALLAVGGAIGVALGSVIAGLIALVKAFTWKQDLARSIVKTYQKEKYLETIFNDIDQYWADTKSSFITASDRVEQDWQDRIAEYESIADEKNIPALEAKIAEARKGLDFFTKIPMPEVG